MSSFKHVSVIMCLLFNFYTRLSKHQICISHDTTLCDKSCQWLVTGRWFSPVSSTNKTDHHDITEILLKVTLNTITLTLTPFISHICIKIYVSYWIFCHLQGDITHNSQICRPFSTYSAYSYIPTFHRFLLQSKKTNANSRHS